LVKPVQAFSFAEEPPVTGTKTPGLEPLDNLFTSFLKKHKRPGVSAAVTHNGKLAYARGFGFADVEAKRPVEPDSAFRLASISKPITAVGILQLLDQGKLKLDDPVLSHIKLQPFPHPNTKPDPRWEKVTVVNCLQHTGGWDRDKKGGFDPIGIPWKIKNEMKLKGHPTPDDIVRYMMGLPLDFKPGGRMAYSNLGYLVLGRVLESVTGAGYEAWIKKHVLAPVRASTFALGRAIFEKRKVGEVSYYDSQKRKDRCLYPPREGQQVLLPDGAENLEGFEAHGGWISSTIDLLRFACAFDYDHKSPLLSPDAIKTMWERPQGRAGYTKGNQPKETYYGCGWDVSPIEKTSKVTAWHGGFITGTSTLLVRRFDGFNWAIFFNCDSSADDKPLADLIDPLMHEAVDAVKKWPAIDLFEKYGAP
jgi:N-acyl-D-amino-acid deacylase